MKFYEVTVKYNGKSITKVFNGFTHSEARVNESNLYNRANSYALEVEKSGKYDKIELVEVDTVTYEKHIFAKFVK